MIGFKIALFLFEILIFKTTMINGSVNISLDPTIYWTFLNQPVTFKCTGNNMRQSDVIWRFFYQNDPTTRFIIYFNGNFNAFDGKYSLNLSSSDPNYITSHLTVNSVEENDLSKVFECVCSLYGACSFGERFARANITLYQTTTTSTTSTTTTTTSTTSSTTTTDTTSTTSTSTTTTTTTTSTTSTTTTTDTTSTTSTTTTTDTTSTTSTITITTKISPSTSTNNQIDFSSTGALRQSKEKINVCEDDGYNLAQYVLLVTSTICFTVTAYLMIYKLHGFLSLDSSKKLKVAVNLSSVAIALNFVFILVFWIKPDLANDKLNAPIIIVTISSFSCFILFSIISFYLIRIFKDNLLPKVLFIWLICEIVCEMLLSCLIIFANAACMRGNVDKYDSTHIANMKVVCSSLFLTFALLVLGKTSMLICKKQVSIKAMFTKITDSSFLKAENRVDSP